MQRINPIKCSVLHHGKINMECSSSRSSAASGMQCRYFVIDIDDKWCPCLSYYKDQFEAPSCKSHSRPDALGTLNLYSFTFTPTKRARRSENLRSWRIDVFSVAKGKMSACKCEKMVLEFFSDEDCHEWQAALSVCKSDLSKFVFESMHRPSMASNDYAVSCPVPVFTRAQCSSPSSEVEAINSYGESEVSDKSSADFLCGHSLALDIPSTW
jgi:hypothetical protein